MVINKDIWAQLSSKVLLILILAFIVVLSSCGSSKKTVITTDSNRTTDTKSNSDNSSSRKMENIKWNRTSEENNPPISYKNGENNELLILKNQYRVNLLLPMGTNQILNEASRNQSIGDNRFLNFYGGAYIAIKDLEAKGVNVSVSVFDTNKDHTLVKSILHSNNNQADLIIGPYTKKEIKIAADYAKNNKVVVVSPWRSVSSSVSSNNEYLIQLRPSLENYRSTIIDHVLSHFKNDEIIIVGQENKTKDKKLIARFQKLNNESSNAPFREFFVDNESILASDTILYHEFHSIEKPVKAVIIPQYLSSDEDYVYGLLRRINVEQGEERVAVYGMPIMYDSEKIDFDLYRSLDLRITRSKFVDYQSTKAKDFQQKYFDEFNALPTDAAFEGYDVMMYFGEGLNAYGIYPQSHLNKTSDRNLQATYEIRRALGNMNDGSSYNYNSTNYYQNIHVDLIEYKDNKFQIIQY